MNAPTHIRFIKYVPFTTLLSLGLIAAFGVTAWYKYTTTGHVFNYSVDFTGGSQVLLGFSSNPDMDAIRQTFADNGWANASLREFSGKNEVLVRVKEFSNDAQGLGQKMLTALTQSIPGQDIRILQSEGVGPSVGESLRMRSVYTVLLALFCMLIYIAVRFWSVGFAVGAVAALFHDAIIMIAAFMLFDKEISVNVIGAILAVLGYSINDTIVIFSKIRENMRKNNHRASLTEVVDLSLNQTLRRTMLTSISTLLTVGSIFFLGGEALHGFAFAMLIGIVFGTYSSIYIASPIMMLFSRNTK
jgi:preprotein translocase subunit SecF